MINANKCFEVSQRVNREYLAKCLAQRLASSPDRAGSWFQDSVASSPEQLLSVLLAAKWEPYDHPEIKIPGVGFRAPIKGFNGMVSLAGLPSHGILTLIDPKGGEEYWTGERSVSPSIRSSEYNLVPASEDFTVLIVGPTRDDSSEYEVWTFHPGNPVKPSMVNRIDEVGRDLHGRQVTVAEARSMGFNFAKLT